MNKLIDGAINFRQDFFEEHRKLYHNLQSSQNPHTLFITCSDSRVLPDLITSSMPGELFIVRNIANMVPSFSNSDEYLTVPSAIEYAVNVLKVKNIIVCGHSNCGGIGALYKSPEVMKGLPYTNKWLELGIKVKEKALKISENDKTIDLQELTEKINIVEQLEHLMTYPYINKSYNDGILSIMGWYYKIETGEIFNYNKSKDKFDLVN